MAIAWRPHARIVSPDSTRSTASEAEKAGEREVGELSFLFLGGLHGFFYKALTNPVSEPKRTRCLHTSAHILDLCRLRCLALVLCVEALEVLPGQVVEASGHLSPNEVVGCLEAGARLGHLHLQRALAKAQLHLLCHEPCDVGAGLGHHVLPRDAQVDVALADEARNIGCGQKDERHGVVLHKRHIEPVGALELDVGALEQLQTLFIESACGCHKAKAGRESERRQQKRRKRRRSWLPRATATRTFLGDGEEHAPLEGLWLQEIAHVCAVREQGRWR